MQNITCTCVKLLCINKSLKTNLIYTWILFVQGTLCIHFGQRFVFIFENETFNLENWLIWKTKRNDQVICNFINEIFIKQIDKLMILCELFHETTYVKFGYWPSLDSVFIHLPEERIFFLMLPEKSFKYSNLPY